MSSASQSNESAIIKSNDKCLRSNYMDDCLGGCVTFGIVSDRQALYPEKSPAYYGSVILFNFIIK